MTTAIDELCRHHLWANERLLDACAALTGEQLDASVPGVYGSIRQTLVHLFASETRYLAAMRGEPRPDELHESKPFPGIDALRAAARANGAAFIELAATVKPGARMQGENRGERYDLPLSVPLAQTINHGTEHRTNITTIMNALGFSPPKLDVWQYARERAGQRS